jgi:type II secretory pathway component PulK
MHSPTSLSASCPQRGIALLVVIMLGAILVPFSAEFAYQINLEVLTANNVTDQLAIDNAIESQYQVILARLEYDGAGNTTDAYGDVWNDDELLQRSEEETGVQTQTTIFDEQGKLNIMMLAEASADRRAIWKQRLIDIIKRFRRDTKFDDVTSQAEEIAEDINRWVTGKANRGAIPKPTTMDDRSMLLLEELNFASEIFEKERLLIDIREGEATAPGLHRYLTVYGNGKLNLNTADKIVLQAFFPNDEDVADRIIERRDGTGEDAAEASFSAEEEDGAGSNPFTDPNQINEVEGVTQPVLLSNRVIPGDDFVVRSNFFSIRIAAQRDASRREELFVVERVPGKDPNGEIEGFRHRLCQERTDPLEYAGPDTP